MNIFITGVSGFIGSFLAKRLLNEGNTVYALCRGRPDFSHPNLNIINSDINDPSSYTKGLKDCELLFHCAAHIGFQKKDYEIAHRVNVDGTRSVLDACLNSSVKKIVHLSACAVLGVSAESNRLIDESSKPDISKDNVYAYTKRLSEEIALEYAQKGLDISIANIATVYGAGDKKMNSGTIIKLIYEGKIKIAPSGGTSYVSVNNLVDGLILLSQKGKSAERYIFCTENLIYKDLFQRIANVLGVKKTFYRIPNCFKQPAIFFANIAELILPKSKDGVNLISGQIIKETFGYKYFNSQKAKKELGWNPKETLEDAVKEAFQYYKSQGLL